MQTLRKPGTPVFICLFVTAVQKARQDTTLKGMSGVYFSIFILHFEYLHLLFFSILLDNCFNNLKDSIPQLFTCFIFWPLYFLSSFFLWVFSTVLFVTSETECLFFIFEITVLIQKLQKQQRVSLYTYE